MEELMAAIHRRYGNKTLIHFEDMTIDNVDKMLSMYRSDFPCFRWAAYMCVRGGRGGMGEEGRKGGMKGIISTCVSPPRDHSK
eukprot:356543-Chlamydomonas_euryale.AAC.1